MAGSYGGCYLLLFCLKSRWIMEGEVQLIAGEMKKEESIIYEGSPRPLILDFFRLQKGRQRSAARPYPSVPVNAMSLVHGGWMVGLAAGLIGCWQIGRASCRERV